MDKTIDHRLAWLAGIIDGEGHISIGVEDVIGKRKSAGKKYLAARWQIGVSNTDPAMLVEIMAICDTIGAKYKYYDRADGPWRGNRKRQGRVHFETKQSCTALLAAILPYLITKRAKADLMLLAIAHRQGYGHCRRSGWLPIANDAAFLGMMKRMTAMNKRGRVSAEEAAPWPQMPANNRA